MSTGVYVLERHFVNVLYFKKRTILGHDYFCIGPVQNLFNLDFNVTEFDSFRTVKISIFRNK